MPQSLLKSPGIRWLRPQMLILLIFVALVVILIWWLWEKFSPPKSFGKVVTLTGAGAKIGPQNTISDPFGIVADGEDLYVTDGLGGKLYRVHKGTSELITDQLEMPSHLALAPDGSLIVANTGAHTIVKVNPQNGAVNIIAGAPNISGDADGKASEARFHGPVGVAVNSQGLIFVADTYNDRIRTIDKNGDVKTLAGSSQGLQDGSRHEAKFDTPCGIAIWGENELLVADTGNHRIRQIKSDGSVSSLILHENGAAGAEKQFNAPVGISTYGAAEFYLADLSGNIYFANMSDQAPKRPPSIPDDYGVLLRYPSSAVYQISAGNGSGLIDGALSEARFSRPTAMALAGKNLLAVADSGNGLIRAVVPNNANAGTKSDPVIATIKADEIRRTVPPRWPYDPPEAKREIAGTLGEIRGERAPEKDAWFHNGLDIPGAYGEQVRAMYNERVTLPIAVEGVNTLRERLRLPLIGYIHVRIARDQNDKSIGIQEAMISRDEKGKVSNIRVPRGTRINAGQVIGTLNSFNHVHLIAGPSAAEVNALAALELPGLVDTMPPIIEGIRVLNDEGEISVDKNKSITVKGKIRIVVRAYDQVDGNAAYRKLGVYKIGFQLLDKNAQPLPDYQEPRFNIEFNRLPDDPRSVAIVYAEPSQSGYTGKTIFDYLVTNIVRDGTAREDALDTTKIPNGEYVMRAVAEDYFRNRSIKDLHLTVAN